jgi:hypothetical protein
MVRYCCFCRYDNLFFFLAAAEIAGFFLAGILSMLRFRASMMSTTLPRRSGAGAEIVTSRSERRGRPANAHTANVGHVLCRAVLPTLASRRLVEGDLAEYSLESVDVDNMDRLQVQRIPQMAEAQGRQ